MHSLNHIYEQVMSFVFGASRSHERFSDRGGLLSYATEWHALIIGLGAALGLGIPGLGAVAATALGLKGMKWISTRKAVQELTKEPWYGIGGALIGVVGHHFGLLGMLFDLILALL